MEKESEYKRDSFIFYRSFYEAIHELKDDIKLEVFTAITEYALYGKVPEDLKPVAKGMFTLIKPNLDVNTARYENGKKGGRRHKADIPKKDDAPIALPVVGTQTAEKRELPLFSSFEEEAKQLKASHIYRDNVCKQLRLDVEEFDRRLDLFVTHCNVEREGRFHSSLTDAKRHFSSWMKKAFKTDDPDNTKQTKEKPTQDDYTFHGGFGGIDV